MKGRTFGITLSLEQAQALHWLARHLCFEDAMQSTPPHLGKEVRTERAYQIVHAVAALQTAIEKAGKHGDAWMYGHPAKAALMSPTARAHNAYAPGHEKPPHWSETAARRGWSDEDA